LNKSLMFINWIKIPGCTSAVLAVKWWRYFYGHEESWHVLRLFLPRN
jgi:hypothetical protein